MTAPAVRFDASTLHHALHPLPAAPAGDAWNREELEGLLPAGATRRPAAVLLALAAEARGDVVWFTRRTQALSRHAGQVSFPGGRMDPGDEGPLATALREAEEEIGLAPRLVEPLGYLDPYETISAFRVVPVVARVDPRFVPVPDPREVDEAFTVPLSFLLDPGNCERVEVRWQGRVRHYWQFSYAGHRIWGATAAMLVNLRERLERTVP